MKQTEQPALQPGLAVVRAQLRSVSSAEPEQQPVAALQQWLSAVRLALPGECPVRPPFQRKKR